MRGLDGARDACERHHPGLPEGLAAIPFAEREAPGSPVIDEFRKHGGAGLLVPARYDGLDTSALDAVRVMCALGSYSPSLGAAAAMHHFTVAMLFALARDAGRLTPRLVDLLCRVAPDGLLLASGWAEGRTEQNILTPSVTATTVDGGYRVNGAKKPCSLSKSMDLLSASVAVPDDSGAPSLAVLLLPAGVPGLSVRPFWRSPVLAAAESDEVRLDDVFVPEDLVIRTAPDDPGRLDDLQTAGFVWFEMLISASYVGAASALVALVLERSRGSVADRANLVIQIESAFGLLDGVARSVDDGESGDESVAAVLVARFAIQETLVRVANLAVELLGGIAFISDPTITYLASAVRPLAFHPPSRTSVAQALVDHALGAPLLLS